MMIDREPNTLQRKEAHKKTYSIAILAIEYPFVADSYTHAGKGSGPSQLHNNCILSA